MEVSVSSLRYSTHPTANCVVRIGWLPIACFVMLSSNQLYRFLWNWNCLELIYMSKLTAIRWNPVDCLMPGFRAWLISSVCVLTDHASNLTFSTLLQWLMGRRLIYSKDTGHDNNPGPTPPEVNPHNPLGNLLLYTTLGANTLVGATPRWSVSQFVCVKSMAEELSVCVWDLCDWTDAAEVMDVEDSFAQIAPLPKKL